MDPKKWYKSRTFWVNIVAAVAAVLAGQFEIGIDADAQVSILALINLAMRSITKTGLAA